MNYEELLSVAENLIESEKYEISLLANVSAFIFEYIDKLNWSGFYLHIDDKLILGPFQGKIACNIIDRGKGVCGTVLDTKKTMVVDDVHTHDNHIACDSNSNSEIVVPIIIKNHVYGVLDIDSFVFSRFDKDIVNFFERLVNLIEKKLKALKNI